MFSKKNRSQQQKDMKRCTIPPKIRLAMLFKANHRCQSCQAKIHPGQKWEIDHIIPLALGGPESLDNMQILCKICQRFKADFLDITPIAKAKRLEIKHFGTVAVTKRPMLGSKASGWKKKFGGAFVLRSKVESRRG